MESMWIIPAWIGYILVLAGGLSLLLIATMAVSAILDHYRITYRETELNHFDIASVMMGCRVHVAGRVVATFHSGKVNRERAIALLNEGWDRIEMDIEPDGTEETAVVRTFT